MSSRNYDIFSELPDITEEYLEEMIRETSIYRFSRTFLDAFENRNDATFLLDNFVNEIVDNLIRDRFIALYRYQFCPVGPEWIIKVMRFLGPSQIAKVIMESNISEEVLNYLRDDYEDYLDMKRDHGANTSRVLFVSDYFGNINPGDDEDYIRYYQQMEKKFDSNDNLKKKRGSIEFH